MFGKKFGNMFGDMQEKQEALREKLKGMEIQAESGGGAVQVTANGIRQIINIDINNDLITGGDVEALEDLILTAVNRALDEAAETEAKETQKMLKDIMPPGLGSLGNLFGG